MGGTKNKGKGGGGGGRHGNRNVNPGDRTKLSRDPGVPGADLRRAGEKMANKVAQSHQRRAQGGSQNYNQGIFGSAGGMARVVAKRKEEEEARQRAIREGYGANAVASVEDEGHHDGEREMTQEEREREQARKVSEMAALGLNASRKQAQHAELDGYLCDNDNDDDRYEHTMGSKAHGGAKTKDKSFARFFSSFQKTLDQSDVLLEVLDARDPMGCQLKKIEQSIASAHGDDKPIVVILNKADLVPDSVVEAWVDYFKCDEQREYVVPFTAAKTRGTTHYKGGGNEGGGGGGEDGEGEEDEDEQTHTLGRTSLAGAAGKQASISKLFSILRKIAKSDAGGRKHISVGVIGYPNVGKSSIINALKRKQVVGVGNTPGFTTGNQEVELRSDIKILDCPGVVMPGEDTGDVVLRNAVKVDQLTDPLCAVERLCERCEMYRLALVYGLDHDTAARLRNATEFVKQVGIRRGRVRQGGNVDEDETAKIILHDWNDGRIGYFTLPPNADLQLPQQVATIGRPGGAEDDDDDESGGRSAGGGPTVVKTLASGIGLDGLPTFHLRIQEPGENSKKKRQQRAHYQRTNTAGQQRRFDDREVDVDEEDDEDDVIEDDRRRAQRKRF